MAVENFELLMTVLLVLFSPPLAVFYKEKDCKVQILYAAALTCLFFAPGVAYASWWCFMKN